jgi:hypothetical protein
MTEAEKILAGVIHTATKRHRAAWDILWHQMNMTPTIEGGPMEVLRYEFLLKKDERRGDGR